MKPASGFSNCVARPSNDIYIVLKKAHLARRYVKQSVTIATGFIGWAALTISRYHQGIAVELIVLHVKTNSIGGSVLAALQTPIYRQTYEAEFAPVGALLDDLIQETPEYNDVLRQTISQLVDQGILVPPSNL